MGAQHSTLIAQDFYSIAPNCAHRQQKFTAEHAESAEKKQQKSLIFSVSSAGSGVKKDRVVVDSAQN
jgi:hypothetical protein